MEFRYQRNGYYPVKVIETPLPCVEWNPLITLAVPQPSSESFSLYRYPFRISSCAEHGNWKIYLQLESKYYEDIAFFILPFITEKNGEPHAFPCKIWSNEVSPKCIIVMNKREFPNYCNILNGEVVVSFTFYFVSKRLLHEPIGTFVANSVETTTGTPSASKSSQQIFSEDIEKLFDNAEHSDAVLKCKDRSFSVNRSILSIRSDVFAAMFRSQMSESQSGVVEITDVPSSVLEQFLHYIYSGKLDTLSMDTVFDLYEASEKYAVLSLKAECASFMADNLSEDNCCTVLLLADTFSDTKLFDTAVGFVSNRQRFLKTAPWKEFARKHPSVAVEVFLKLEAN